MRNPLSYGRSYFPPWGEGLAYHAITHGHVWQDVEDNFEQVWRSGWILAASERARGAGAIMGLDVAAKDHENVFLSVSQPLSFQKDSGYYFAYDVETLLDQLHALGIGDLLEAFQDAFADSGTPEDRWRYGEKPLYKWPDEMAATFLEGAEQARTNLRLMGQDAERWAAWLFDETDEPWDLIQRAQDFVDNTDGSFVVPSDLDMARRFAEIVIRHHVSLSRSAGLHGVAFRHIYFGLVDFNRLFQTEPGTSIDLDLGHNCMRMGYPYRCPQCQQPMVEGDDAREVLDQNPWVKVELEVEGGELPAVPCEECQAFLILVPSAGSDPYEVAEGDLFVPFGDVLRSRSFHPGSCL